MSLSPENRALIREHAPWLGSAPNAEVAETMNTLLNAARDEGRAALGIGSVRNGGEADCEATTEQKPGIETEVVERLTMAVNATLIETTALDPALVRKTIDLIQRITGERDEAVKDCFMLARRASKEIDRVTELGEALRPFAEFSRVLAFMGGPTPRTGAYATIESFEAGPAELTVEDFRRAAQALATSNASQGEGDSSLQATPFAPGGGLEQSREDGQ